MSLGCADIGDVWFFESTVEFWISITVLSDTEREIRLLICETMLSPWYIAIAVKQKIIAERNRHINATPSSYILRNAI